MNRYFIIDAPEEYHKKIKAKISELIWKDKLGVRQIISSQNPDNVRAYINAWDLPYKDEWDITAIASPGIPYTKLRHEYDVMDSNDYDEDYFDRDDDYDDYDDEDSENSSFHNWW